MGNVLQSWCILCYHHHTWHFIVRLNLTIADQLLVACWPAYIRMYNRCTTTRKNPTVRCVFWGNRCTIYGLYDTHYCTYARWRAAQCLCRKRARHVHPSNIISSSRNRAYDDAWFAPEAYSIKRRGPLQRHQEMHVRKRSWLSSHVLRLPRYNDKEEWMQKERSKAQID